MNQLVKSISRRKQVDLSSSSKLKRCLGTLDLTALGVGATLGVGTYVLAGAISKYQSGPAVSLSMAVAAFASIFAGDISALNILCLSSASYILCLYL